MASSPHENGVEFDGLSGSPKSSKRIPSKWLSISSNTALPADAFKIDETGIGRYKSPQRKEESFVGPVIGNALHVTPLGIQRRQGTKDCYELLILPNDQLKWVRYGGGLPKGHFNPEVQTEFGNAFVGRTSDLGIGMVVNLDSSGCQWSFLSANGKLRITDFDVLCHRY